MSSYASYIDLGVHGFPQSLQETARIIIPSDRPWLILSISFPVIHTIILPFDAA
jgi:hypothetical protein